jgi:hypothetical protein
MRSGTEYSMAYCPKCRFSIYSKKKIGGPVERYKFKCTCGCEFTLEKRFVTLVEVAK